MTQSRPAFALTAPAIQADPLPARPDITGCSWHDIKERLREVGLRPTRQRMTLGWILFARGDRHVTAEMLYEEAIRAKVPVSLATVYNTLHQLTDVGLVRQIAVDSSKTYFDTNNSPHHHFFIEGENDLMDIPTSDLIANNLWGQASRAPHRQECRCHATFCPAHRLRI